MHSIGGQSLVYVINRTALKMRNDLNRRFKPYDITAEQWGLLKQLCNQDGVSQKDIADRLIKDQPAITRILDKLEHKGLIERRAHPDDRRAFLIFLTSEGRKVIDLLAPVAKRSLEKALLGLEQGEKELLRRALNRICDNLA